MAFLDCCRSFIYKDKHLTRGLGETGEVLREDIIGPVGTVISHACAPNYQASDGVDNDHGGSLFPIPFSLVESDDDQCHYVRLYRAFYGAFAEVYHVGEHRSLHNGTASRHSCQEIVQGKAATGFDILTMLPPIWKPACLCINHHAHDCCYTVSCTLLQACMI